MKLERFKFGDIIENGWASKDNPTRIGIFVRHKKKTIEKTNGKGKFWETYHDSDNKNKKIGTIFDNPELLEGGE
ncbi:hypothetical protein Pryu01_03027 [Paraliobacillus ryukyuensis]|uniref:YopX protein domain-containing protein n=1 Tax=Paraliobacillus ryukyuensis TaxID=200904 RepID=A0A366DPL2_9BACI|nr:hypothetical protein [Paraliobacillus ryukyuensis]RBO92041.1 hypothetical protein DES48_1175 [Paraliobacillus ryukyuensis]